MQMYFNERKESHQFAAFISIFLLVVFELTRGMCSNQVLFSD
jgi:hypothetical protein